MKKDEVHKALFESGLKVNRRQFLSRASVGIGSVALGSLLIPDLFSRAAAAGEEFIPGVPHFAPKAKRVIYLFQSGAPSQLESFDYKTRLREMMGQDLPDSVRGGQRLTGMTAGQDSLPLVGSSYDFKQYGADRAWCRVLCSYTAQLAKEFLG